MFLAAARRKVARSRASTAVRAHDFWSRDARDGGVFGTWVDTARGWVRKNVSFYWSTKISRILLDFCDSRTSLLANAKPTVR